MSKIAVAGGIKGKIVVKNQVPMMAGEQNDGIIGASYSGTGRNIVENLRRMGADVAMAATAGNDFVGKGAKAELEQLGVDTSLIRLIDGQNTAMNISVLNVVEDLEFAMNNTDVYKCFTTEMAKEVLPVLNGAEVAALDGSLEADVLRYFVENLTVPVFFDPHTEEDAEKVAEFIGAFHTIKPNRAEASAICNMQIFSEEQLMEAGRWFAEQGVKRIFITMSGGGVYYKEGEKEGIIRPEAVLPFANEEGAGDAFSAAILDGTVKAMDVEAIANYGMKAAAIAMECKGAVNPQMSERRMQE